LGKSSIPGGLGQSVGLFGSVVIKHALTRKS
jgi:hypothetical protein